MLSIGDFSQLGQVSVRTLRLYDELHLLQPTRVDPFTNYRYYSIEQLPRLNRILMLKDLGLSLEQIARLLKENLPADQLRGMLVTKQTALQKELAENRERLERVEARLRQIEQEGHLTAHDIILKTVTPFDIFSVRQLVPSITVMPQQRCELFHLLYHWLEEKHIEPNGQELAIYHNEEYTEQDIDMEAAIVANRICRQKLASAMMTNEPVSFRELPGTDKMASVIHQGRPKEVGIAIIALYTWIEENNYLTTGPYREIHLYGRELELKTYDPVTIEVQIPVKPNEN